MLGCTDGAYFPDVVMSFVALGCSLLTSYYYNLYVFTVTMLIVYVLHHASMRSIHVIIEFMSIINYIGGQKRSEILLSHSTTPLYA